MPFRVLVVDDSNFFQHRLKEIINENPELKVVGIASNGREAVEKAKSLKPDIITMDFEMPVMDGVTAIKLIMADRKVPILMFSSLTYEGARITLDALEAGALDFIPKDFAEVSRNSVSLKHKLHERLITLARSGSTANTAPVPDQFNTVPQFNSQSKTSPSRISSFFSSSKETPKVAPVVAPVQSHFSRTQPAVEQPQSNFSQPQSNTSPTQSNFSQAQPVASSSKSASISYPTDNYRFKRPPKLLIVGASTGGPVAVADVLTKLPQHFPLPIVLVQHMPENFTKAFAERLDKICNIRVREAVDGDLLEPGLALLAPGGKQLMLDKRNGGCVRVFTENDRATYKPSLDITFGSAANNFGDKVLGIVLTGMGSDGCQGARLLKEADSTIWSQDEASCVIYGMPMAVARAGLTDRVLSLSEIGVRLAREIT